MDTCEFRKAITYLYENHKLNANDIYECLELLYTSLEESYDTVNSDVYSFFQKRDVSSAQETQKHLSLILDVQNKLKSALAMLDDCSNDNPEEVVDDQEDGDNDEQSLNTIDYSLYAVNRDTPHMLSENYIHKKICGFMFNGTKYNVDNWQDGLVSLCNILYEKNSTRFEELSSMPEFKGRKVRYLDTESVPNFNQNIKGSNIYVWINLSANGKRNMMKKLLRAFSINTNTFYIYLRADLTPLHISGSKDTSEPSDTETRKIGKYVSAKMRQLSKEDYKFNDKMLESLLDKGQSNSMLGINFPLFRMVNESKPIAEQTKDSLGRIRYWKDVFHFNNKDFLITSQWFDNNREAFDRWFDSL